MPLSRTVHLWPFVALPAGVGGCYLLLDPVRFSGPAFNAAKSMAPMPTWGVVSVVVAVLIVAALLERVRTGEALHLSIAMVGGASYYAWWAFVLAVNAAQTPNASPTGAMFVAMAALGYLVGAIQIARRKDGW